MLDCPPCPFLDCPLPSEKAAPFVRASARRRSRHRRATASGIAAAVVILVAQSFTPMDAHGAGPVTDPARAEQLIEQANKLRSEGQDQKAVPLLKQAYDLAPSPRAAGQLGLGELAVG